MVPTSVVTMLFNTATRVGTVLLYHHAFTNHMLKPNEHIYIYIFIYLLIYLSIYLFIYLFVYYYLAKHASVLVHPLHSSAHGLFGLLTCGWTCWMTSMTSYTPHDSGPQMLSCRLRDLILASDLAVYADAPLIWCLSELHPTDCVR